MKAILKFNLDDPDDAMAHLRAIKSADIGLALFEIVYNLKKECERKAESAKDSDIYDGIDLVFNELSKVLEEHNINIDEIIR